ncbi:MAG: Tll0287-like domain-containing protein, partial [Alphaproteobacteria bacterium]
SAGGAAATTPPAKETETAIYLAELLRSARIVISAQQTHINNPDIGDKGLTGRVILAKTREIFRQRTGMPLPLKDENDVRTRLLRAQLASIREVMDENQRAINRAGVGFKGFVPAVFARLVNERFKEKMGDYAEVKVTPPMNLVRNRRARPDAWERSNIRKNLMAPDWPVGRIYTEAAEDSGRKAFRVLVPEYYGKGCLSCHGGPKGEIDVTGYPKEGGKEGWLGGAISITLFRR